jgi:hypothetical protein
VAKRVTTFDPDCGPRAHAFSPGAGVTGELFDDYKGVSDRWWAEVDYLRLACAAMTCRPCHPGQWAPPPSLDGCPARKFSL